MTTRLLAAAIFVIAAAYTSYGNSYSVAFGDVLGPSVFPVIVGIPAMLISGSLVAFPSGIFEWPGTSHIIRQAVAIGVMLSYAWLLKGLGFPLATFGLIAALSVVLGGNPLRSVVLGAVMSLSIWMLFDQLLGLPLAFLGYFFGD